MAFSSRFAALLRGLRQPFPLPYPTPEQLVFHPEVEAWVTRHDQTVLELGWQAAIQPVQVYAGDRPDRIDRTRPVAEVMGEESLTLAGFEATRRHYFEIHATYTQTTRQSFIIAERFLPFQGIANFRDIGGYRTIKGRRVRWGCVYRCGVLSTPTEQDRLYLEHLNPRLICDLRTGREVAERPDDLPESLRPAYRYTPIYHRDQIFSRINALIFKRQRLAEVLRAGYLDVIDERAEFFGEMLRLIARPENLPVVFHCTAGKDRTGMLVALLLLALGVPEPVVVADYSLSNLYYQTFWAATEPSFKRLRPFGLTSHHLQPLLVADPETMQAMIRHINHKYGSVERYLHQAAGVDQRVLRTLRENLLV